MATEQRAVFQPARVDRPIAPGEVLAEELEARGMTQTALARAMGRPLQAVNGIIAGRKSITAQTALQLEAVLGIKAELWMNLESAYQLAKARQRGALSA